MSDRLIGIRAKIERAKHHIHDVETSIETFRKTDPYRLLCQYDPQSSERIFSVQVCSVPPLDFRIIIGEAIQQLRSSLGVWLLDSTSCHAKWSKFPNLRDCCLLRSH